MLRKSTLLEIEDEALGILERGQLVAELRPGLDRDARVVL